MKAWINKEVEKLIKEYHRYHEDKDVKILGVGVHEEAGLVIITRFMDGVFKSIGAYAFAHDGDGNPYVYEIDSCAYEDKEVFIKHIIGEEIEENE